MFFHKLIGSLMTSANPEPCIGRRTFFKALIIQVRHRTPWWGLCDTVHWKVWCLPGHNCLHPSSSYGRPGGGGGKRHKGNQLLHRLLQLERARKGIKISTKSLTKSLYNLLETRLTCQHLCPLPQIL